jgi:hypothetical protein
MNAHQPRNYRRGRRHQHPRLVPDAPLTVSRNHPHRSQVLYTSVRLNHCAQHLNRAAERRIGNRGHKNISRCTRAPTADKTRNVTEKINAVKNRRRIRAPSSNLI